MNSMEQQYVPILRAYLAGQREEELYGAQQLGKWLFQQKMPPEEVVDLHLRALEQCGEVPDSVRASFQLLMEVMIEYGNAYRAHHSLLTKQRQLQSEIEMAVSMQLTLLPQRVPSIPGLEIGVVSVPAKQMSGDYYNIVQHDDNTVSVVIADITGKGVPAALGMSMIKYAMDSYLESVTDPAAMLAHINGVVERNVDPCMFVTMLYGRYDLVSHRFRYAVAGHEPGFLYRAAEDRMCELIGQGPALGIEETTRYQAQEIALNPGDYLILVTDGVTDCRIYRYYKQREELVSLLRSQVGLSAQEMVDHLHRKLRFTDFDLADDFTMIVLHRK